MSSDNQNKRARSENNESEGSDDWKSQPPYKANDEMKKKTKKITGSCHCGDVSFEIYADKPMSSHFCQCVAPGRAWKPELAHILAFSTSAARHATRYMEARVCITLSPE
jgi:hypothetical protein